MKRRGAGTLSRAEIGERVLLQGWVHRRRDHGGVLFLNLRDRSGIVQTVVRPDEHPEVAAVLDDARLEWVIEVEGVVSERAPEAVNREMPTGQLEVIADRGVVLSRTEPLPFTPEGKGDVTEETRLRHRYLDLRTPELQANLELRHRVTLEILNYFDEQEFLHVETPILNRSTPEGARDYLVPSRVHPGSFYALPQSPQIFKQLCMVAGLERYIQIARCFRDEDLRADRQPEFTQVDLELSFIDEEVIYELIEGLFVRLFGLIGVEVPTPFPRLSYGDAMLRFGSDKPDIRFGMEIVDLSDIVAESGFRAFKGTVADGGVVRGFTIPNAAAASRKQVDGWVEVARRYGAAGVLTLKRKDGESVFQVKTALSDEELGALTERLGLEDGSLALIVAAPEKTAAAALGSLRLELAATYEQIPEGEHSFLWVTDFPLVEWDEEDGRFYSVNHPFTSPKLDQIDGLEDAPASVLSRGYDVILNGFELGGGSIRIHDSALQSRVFKLLGIDDEEARDRFGFLLDALRFGAPPHGGIALGLDRIIMLMAGAPSLREVIAFPKTTSAMSLMSGAPSRVEPDQLAELGIEIQASSEREDS